MADSLTPKEEFLLNPVTEHNITDAAIATFETNLRHPLKVEIPFSPKQDLHGYDNPWPGGGGKNLLPDLKFQRGTQYVYLGQDVGQSYFQIHLVSGTYTLSVDNTVSASLYYKETQDESATKITSSGTDRVGTFTLASDGDYQFWLYAVDGITASDITKFQLEAGSIVTAYAPYSNICPISGHTGAEISNAAVNIWDEEWEVGGIGSNGQNDGSSNRIRSKEYIGVVGGETYYTTARIAWFEYDANKAFLREGNGGNFVGDNVSFTPSADAYYIRFVCTTSYGTTYNNDISINYPATDTTYHPYTGNQIYVNWQTEAGTVYSGSYEVATGKLINRTKKIVAKNMTWSKHTSGIFYVLLRDKENVNVNRLWCDTFKVHDGNADGVASASRTLSNFECIASAGSQNPYIYVSTPDETVEVFLENYGDTEFIYELAEPTEYTLTPQPITALYGTNNIWSDIGNVNVKYLTQNSNTGMEYRGDRALELRRRAMLADAPTIHTSIGSSDTGGLASFKSYIKAPVKKIEIPFGPVQDLHGYDHPWPAGGNVNIGNFVMNKGVNTNGIVDNTSGRAATVDPIQIESGKSYYVKATGVNPKVIIAVWNGDTLVRRTAAISLDTALDVSGGTDLYVCVYENLSSDKLVGIDENQLMVVTDNSITEYRPYSNICPISGHTGAEVTGTGENLIDWKVSSTAKAVYLKPGTYVLSWNGTFSNSGLWYMRAKDGSGNYYNSTSALGLGAAWAHSNSSHWNYANVNVPIVFTVPIGCSVVEFFRQNTDGTIPAQLELGSTATDYVPYTGNQISVTFPASAGDSGTVYGGMLTLNQDRTGTLVVDKGIVDLGTLTWIKMNPGQFYSETNFGAVNTTNILCNVFRYGQAYSAAENNVIELRVGTYHRVWVRSMAYDGRTASEFKTAMSGVQLVYLLASPQTIQLTDTEVSTILTTLYGTNNIWCDISDDITVKYWNRGFGN